MKKISKIIVLLLVLVYFISLIYLILNWNNMNDIIGVHFDLLGDYLTFDVYDKKIYSLYPYIINGIILLITIFVSKKIDKFRPGLKVNEEGERILKIYIQLFTYIISICTFIFFTSWMYCVINQCNMNIFFISIPMNFMVVDILSIIPAIILIKIIYNQKMSLK